MADYKPGNMDIRAKEKTFNGFVSMVKWGVIIAIVVLVVLALADA